MPLKIARNKEFKETLKSTDILLADVRRHVMKKSMEPDDDRRTDVLHPSEMSKSTWCPRHDYYLITGAITADNSMNSFRTESIFDYGHSVHRKWQGWFHEMGILWGRWQCLNEQCEYSFYETSPKHCPACGSVVAYREVPIVDDDWLLAGHADGAIRDLKAIVEIKSVGLGTVRMESCRRYEQFINEQLTPDELWFRINRPFSSHIRQAMIYLHFMRLRYGAAQWDKLIFIYEWKANQDAKEFVIKYNKSYIDNTLLAMQTVVRAKNEGVPPERPTWALPSHKVCSKCPAKSTCYGNKDQATEESASAITVVRTTANRRRRALHR